MKISSTIHPGGSCTLGHAAPLVRLQGVRRQGGFCWPGWPPAVQPTATQCGVGLTGRGRPDFHMTHLVYRNFLNLSQ